VEARAELGDAMSTEGQRKHRAELARIRYAKPETRQKILDNAKKRYASLPKEPRAVVVRPVKTSDSKKAYMRKYYQANRPRLLSAIRKRAGVPEPTRPQPSTCEVVGCLRKATCADHEHLTGTFRGWLCAPCNRAASKYHTSALLRALADYVERHS
jgi:Recombination endonuclease VII